MIEFENKEDKLCELFKDRPIGILDLQSIGYYKVSYQRLIAMAEERFDWFHYTKRLHTKRDENMEHYNRMSGSLHRERGKPVHCTEPYPWLAPDDLHRF